jgi:hypothetical protein
MERISNTLASTTREKEWWAVAVAQVRDTLVAVILTQ